ncbi:hypothetical protein Tco_1204421 [Tanacetum coccineum]
MAALVIPISSDSSDESVGSHVLRVILFGTIPTSIPVILVVPSDIPIAPANPLIALEDSLHVAPELPLVSPILCSDDSKANSVSEPAEQRPERHESLTLSSEFPLALVVAPLEIRRRPTILVRPDEAIPFGQPYPTHPNRPRKLLIARKIVEHIPACRLAWRRVSHRSLDRHSLLDFTSDSSSSSSSLDSPSDISSGSSSDSLSDSSPVHSSGCDASGQSHSGPSTKVESYRSSLDSSSERSLDSSSPFVVPSRKRCRSPTTLVPSSTPIPRLISPALADLLPCKRFRDSYLSEASREEHMEIGTTDAEIITDLGISDGVGAHTEDGIYMGVGVATSDIREDEEEFEVEANTGDMREVAVDPLANGGISDPTGGDAPDLEGTLYDIANFMSEAPLDRITEVRSLGRENLRVRDLLCIERDRVNSLRHHMALSKEEFRQIRRDRDDTQRRLRRLESFIERRLVFRR